MEYIGFRKNIMKGAIDQQDLLSEDAIKVMYKVG